MCKKEKQRISIVMLVILILCLFHCVSLYQETNAKEKTPGSYAAAEEELLQGTTEEENGAGVQYIYDKLNRLTKVSYADGSVITYSYDKNGNLLESRVAVMSAPTPTATQEPTATEKPTVTITPSITEKPFSDNTVEVYYGNESWNQAYIHYKVGNGQWTAVPGVKMSSTNQREGYQWKYTIDLGNETEAAVCFNDGNGNWDSKYGENYKVYTGIYAVKNGEVNQLGQSSITPTVTETPYSDHTVEIYYGNDSWQNAYIHYQTEYGEWTSVPGIKMSKADDREGYQWKYTIDLGNSKSVAVCFNDGNNNWDSRNAENYKVYAGCYGIKNGEVKLITAPEGNAIEVYYSNTSWERVYIHYKAGNDEWTSVPGVEMDKATDTEGYQWKYIIYLGSETEATVCFNDGNNNWDSRNAENYQLSQPGIYGIKKEIIYQLK